MKYEFSTKFLFDNNLPAITRRLEERQTGT